MNVVVSLCSSAFLGRIFLRKRVNPGRGPELSGALGSPCGARAPHTDNIMRHVAVRILFRLSHTLTLTSLNSQNIIHNNVHKRRPPHLPQISP